MARCSQVVSHAVSRWLLATKPIAMANSKPSVAKTWLQVLYQSNLDQERNAFTLNIGGVGASPGYLSAN
jgi:hypothetical protein